MDILCSNEFLNTSSNFRILKETFAARKTFRKQALNTYLNKRQTKIINRVQSFSYNAYIN